jgi:Fur family transcriptional regulator, peroxide stress response regulator
MIDALVENCETHPGATLIYEAGSKKARRVRLSSVYATLKEFSESDLIRQLEFDRLESRYDVDLLNHVNLTCNRCGKIIDYAIPASLEPRDIARKSGFVVTDTRLEFHGYCRNCLKRPD